MASLSSPKPIRILFAFNSFSNKATIGILPPLLIGTAFLPNESPRAFTAASYPL